MNTDLRIKLTDLAGILGGVFMVYFGTGYLLDKFPIRLHALPELPPPAPALPGQPAKPRLMTESPLRLVPGRRYGVSLDTPALIPVSNNTVKGVAENRGFTNVDVSSKPPPGWPGNTKKSDADTWVVALYVGEPRTQARSESGVDIVEAFEG